MALIKPQVFALSALLAVTAAQAQTNAAPPARAPTNMVPVVFDSADTNSDGRVCRDEFKGHVKKTAFETMDADGDGMISLEEWKAVDNSPEAEKNFAALDKDRNGRISYPEFSDAIDGHSRLNDAFASLDKDRDSHLAPEELTGRPMFRLLSVKF